MNAELIVAARERNRALLEEHEKAAFVGKALAGVGKGLLTGAKKHPLAAGFAYVSLAPEKINPIPMLKWPLASKVPAVREQTRNTARQVMENKQLYRNIDSAGNRRINMKKTSSVFSQDGLNETLRISQSLTKTARIGRVVNPDLLRQIALVGSVGMGLGVGTQVGSYGVSKLMSRGRTRNEKRFYGDMLKADPGLRREPGARGMFNIVNRASPYLASEPIIAAATVRSMLDSPALDERKLQQLLTTEKLRQDTEFPWRNSGKETALKDAATLALI